MSFVYKNLVSVVPIGGINKVNGDTGSATPTAGAITITGGTSGSIFTGAGSTLTESFNYLSLPTTTSTNGQMLNKSVPMFHSYGTQNTFVGANSGNFTLSGSANNGLGLNTLHALTSGNSNVAIGASALALCTTGTYNTSIGAGSGTGITTGNYNVTIGYQVMANGSKTGDYNFASGYQSCFFLTSGTNNIGIGQQTLNTLSSGSYNIALGYNTGSNADHASSSNIYLNNIGISSASNTLYIGSATGTGNQQLAAAYICGIDGVNVGSVAKVVTMASDQLGTATITAGSGISVTPTANTITIAATGTTNLTYTNVNTSPYVVLSTDEYLSVDCSGGAITVELPNAATSGRTYIIKDRTGSAATHNITVQSVSGAVNIDGATTYVMNTAYSSIQVIGNGSTYEIF